MERIDLLSECPVCKGLWDGGPVPKKYRKFYSAPYRFSRLVGVEIPEKYDGISYWECPDCKTQWDRWTNLQVLPKSS
jgi:hypothetical protein